MDHEELEELGNDVGLFRDNVLRESTSFSFARVSMNSFMSSWGMIVIFDARGRLAI
jgi:hypothetical protein